MTVISEHLDSATWWTTIQDQVDTPIGDLIDGFDEIADHAIPYGRLPGRAHTFYAAAFATWSDLASETITSLVERPKGGIGTVRAMVITAREAVAVARSAPAGDEDAATAIRRLLDRLTDYDYTVLSARGWALQPKTIPVTASQLGVAPVNVQRNQPRAQNRFEELLSDPAHATIADYAADLRRRLGPLTCEQTAQHALHDVGLDLASDTGQVLLHLAGPYARKDRWLEDINTDALAAAAAIVQTALDEHGAPTTPQLVAELGTIGIHPPIAAAFINSRPGLRSFGDRWVRWGSSVADKVEAALHLSAAPASPSMIAATLGDSSHEKRVRDVLNEDPRFVRTSKQTWALRRWGRAEYTGLFSEIAARIDARRCPISTREIIDDLLTTFPDVAETSIRAYLGAPGFIVEDGKVRRRSQSDGWPDVAPLNTVRGVFRNGRNEIRVALPVDSDLLRGSGQLLNPATATALGIHPGQERKFAGTLTDITLFWRQSALNGASVGSLRAPATTLGAQLGDTLVLAFNLRDSTADVSRIGADADDRTRLRALLGKTTRNPAAALARALACKPDDLAALLARRGDSDVLTLLKESRS